MVPQGETVFDQPQKILDSGFGCHEWILRPLQFYYATRDPLVGFVEAE
jgi:hypothetical protein